ncbi:hypothetical protein NE237_033137 [Protea cynaroides]|uniref:Uncharacterized protein n=1 Tax=Protea cynaroides TaxID=273540 RepID=A0A9Q0R3R8_9MAGN|nr:hypothetical protein NE237_033137 [Protea cynaroides]
MCLGQQEKGFGTPKHLWETVLGELLKCKAEGNLRGRADHSDYDRRKGTTYNWKPVALPSNESLDVAQPGFGVGRRQRRRSVELPPSASAPALPPLPPANPAKKKKSSGTSSTTNSSEKRSTSTTSIVNSDEKKKDVDYAIPFNELPIVIADGIELESRPPVREPSSSSNKESDCSEVLKTLSMAEEKVFNNEPLELLRKYESVILDLNKEKENIIVKRRKVFVEREKAIEGKEKLEKELKEMKDEKLTFSIQLEELKEKKKSLETRLKEAEDSIQIKVDDAVIKYRDFDDL